MWEQYRKRFVLNQVFFAAICAVLWFAFKRPAAEIVILVVVMEVFALIGAAWAARLKRKIEGRPNALPLSKH